MRRSERAFPSAMTGGLLILLTGLAGAAMEPADLIIRGGLVHDGSAAAPAVADVVIRGERIIHVGPAAGHDFSAAQLIDAGNRIVAPGFIDPHTHADGFLFADDPAERLLAPWLFQGVTTVMIGVDGAGPVHIGRRAAALTELGSGVNVGQYVGFGAVRKTVLGDAARAPSDAELTAMRTLVADAMCEGAFGLSSGLFYTPQAFADTAEVVAVAREAARRGGLYDTHQRDESSYGPGLLESTREAIRIGREAGLPVHIAHIKALGVDVHGMADQVIGIIEAARADGVRVTADQYPWLASGTGLTAALVPTWARDGGPEALLERLDDPGVLARIRDEMTDNLRRRGGPGSLLMTEPGFPWSARTLHDMAVEWALDPIDAALRIVRASAASGNGDRVASFNMSDDDVVRFMRQPWVITGSDGSRGHPRQYATFPRKYRHYVVERQVLTAAEFVHRSSGLSAEILGLEQRGYLRPGYFADVVVFDPERFGPRADYVHPTRLSEGVDHLIVNGRRVLDGGVTTGAAAGRVLLHDPTPGSCGPAP